MRLININIFMIFLGLIEIIISVVEVLFPFFTYLPPILVINSTENKSAFDNLSMLLSQYITFFYFSLIIIGVIQIIKGLYLKNSNKQISLILIILGITLSIINLFDFSHYFTQWWYWNF